LDRVAGHTTPVFREGHPDKTLKSATSNQSSRLSPDIRASLPEWIDPNEAETWPDWQIRHVAFKHCSRCGELKPLVAFHRMRSMVSGRYPRCKECRRIERLQKH
jgi:hypothetical protein